MDVGPWPKDLRHKSRFLPASAASKRRRSPVAGTVIARIGSAAAGVAPRMTRRNFAGSAATLNAMTMLPMDAAAGQSRDYARVAAAIEYILDCRPDAPSLDDLAGHVGLSPYHFQRLFKRWAGVSPKQFMGFLAIEHAKAVLERSSSVLEAAFDVGLSGPSRLHDLFVGIEAMTPGEYKTKGRDLVIRYGVHDTRFGRALIMITSRGVCGLEFFTTEDEIGVVKRARERWPLSAFIHDPGAVQAVAGHIASASPGAARGAPFKLLLRGTNFQIHVWAALLRIPSGSIVSYRDIANAVGQPRATRAVGNALAANGIGYLVPCHRVLQSTGMFRSYRWGAARRFAMLGWESASRELPVT